MGDLDASQEMSLDDLTPEARTRLTAILERSDARARRAQDRARLDTVPCPHRSRDAAIRAWMEEARREQGITRAASTRHVLEQVRLYRTNKALMAAITEAYREGLYDGIHGNLDDREGKADEGS